MMRPLNAIAVAALLSSTALNGVAQTPAASSRPTAFHVLEATISDVQAAFRSGGLTCRTLVEHYLNRIKAYDKRGPALNAVQTVNPDAVSEADRLDAAFRSSGPQGPLHCVPILLKDQVETSNMPTTYGSAVFKDFVPQRDATIVKRLKQAGAIIVAKTNMGEFASHYVGSAFGVIRNPYDPKRTAAGSSGGTGAGIGANYATVGIGEDTGGSIRGPAAFSSLVGLRPSVPLVSRFGMMPSRPTQDTLGPIARTVRDAAILLDAISGYDPNDSVTAYSVGQVPPTYTAFLRTDGLKGARLGVIREPMDPKTDPASDDYKKVRAVIERAIADLKKLGAETVDPIAIPDLQGRIKRMYDDNVYESEQATNAYLAEHPNAPAKTVRDILLSGKVVPLRARTLLDNVGKSTDQAGYLAVLNSKEETRQIILKIMAANRLDALVYATSDHQPTLIAEDVLTNPYTKDEYRLGSNRFISPSLGFPALTVPAGFTTDGLPVGIEFMGRIFSEPVLLKLGYAYEQGTHNRKAPASTPALSGEP
jgi:Asp-tRNA(Asn)/Glu-tRNA(Gln) amidotransferase A subunit family amidase